MFTRQVCSLCEVGLQAVTAGRQGSESFRLLLGQETPLNCRSLIGYNLTAVSTSFTYSSVATTKDVS